MIRLGLVLFLNFQLGIQRDDWYLLSVVKFSLKIVFILFSSPFSSLLPPLPLPPPFSFLLEFDQLHSKLFLRFYLFIF